MGESESHNKMEEEAVRLGELAKELQESASIFISKTTTEEQSLRQRALSINSNIQKLRSTVRTAALHPHEAERLDEELFRAKCILTDGDAASFLPNKSHGKFLKMFLGPINVRATRKDVQLKVKEEYNKYRDRTAFLFLLFPSTLLFLRSWVWNGCLPALPVQLYQAWLLFLYTSLALRENILRVNGSDIRSWWIYHHYCAMVMALSAVQLFLLWAVMQGVAMLLQNRYQRQRLYTRIALGKANRMDVVWGETAGVEGQLWILCPILFILQVVVCGILLVVMAVGNFANTVQTLMSKSRVKAKIKKSKSKLELDQGTLRKNS
ncbi:hypothetical protein IFM89_018622 [Coptis chinensis]|uniref:Transmembrane protein 120 homolog n=1 Tax=Coptis chinensis TaxID=261450 RepID=A0A835H457_9MAGN|nr:hypothetical protein IFM89_018622 [Coptis chinensis]